MATTCGKLYMKDADNGCPHDIVRQLLNLHLYAHILYESRELQYTRQVNPSHNFSSIQIFA